MSAAKYDYRLEALDGERWVRLGWHCTLAEARGYITCHRETPGPRLAMRIVRSDGKVVDESGALPDAGIGMVAGWPTAEQYLHAAARCVKSAAAVLGRPAAMRRDIEPGSLAPAIAKLEEAIAALRWGGE